MFVSKLLKDREIVWNEKVKLKKENGVKESELRLLRETIFRMEKEMTLMRV